MAPAATTHVLDRLKADTRAEHIAMEAALDLMRDDFSLADYRQLLACYVGFYEPIEARLACVLPTGHPGLDFEARRKTALLRADLDALGGHLPDTLTVPLPMPLPLPLPICDALPPLQTPAQAMGCLYVLEGATLGGQVIGQHLRRRLGLTPEAGARFFHGNGARTAEMWRAFRAALSHFTEASAPAPTSATADAIVASANATFRSLQHWCVQQRACSNRPHHPPVRPTSEGSP